MFIWKLHCESYDGTYEIAQEIEKCLYHSKIISRKSFTQSGIFKSQGGTSLRVRVHNNSYSTLHSHASLQERDVSPLRYRVPFNAQRDARSR